LRALCGCFKRADGFRELYVLCGCFRCGMQSTVNGLTLLEPRSLADALRLLRDEAPLTPLAGCTDLYVGLNFGTLKEKRFLNLWRLDTLRTIEVRRGILTIGA